VGHGSKFQRRRWEDVTASVLEATRGPQFRSGSRRSGSSVERRCSHAMPTGRAPRTSQWQEPDRLPCGGGGRKRLALPEEGAVRRLDGVEPLEYLRRPFAVLGGHAEQVSDVLDEFSPGVLDLGPGRACRDGSDNPSAPSPQPRRGPDVPAGLLTPRSPPGPSTRMPGDPEIAVRPVRNGCGCAQVLATLQECQTISATIAP